MQMFPHAFFPFLPVHLGVVTSKSKAARGRRTEEAPLKQDSISGTRPVNIDVEKAVAAMMATSEIKSDDLRQKFRLDVIKTVPSKSIDWDTVDWVQMWPFQTTRQ
jgi:hypothetical protein